MPSRHKRFNLRSGNRVGVILYTKDQAVAQVLKMATGKGLVPILCVLRVLGGKETKTAEDAQAPKT